MSTLKVNQLQDATGAVDFLSYSNGAATGHLFGRRNLIINGAMQVAQRGTSFSSLTTGQYTLDRWEYNPSGATATITQESFAAGTEEGGCKNYLKAAFSVGNDNGGMIYKVEDVQSLHSAESFTLSFYAKGTNPTGGAVRVRVRQYFGSGGSATVTVYEDTITLTSSWQRFTITDTYDDLTGKTIGTGSYADITIDQPGTDSGTDAWELNITGVQLEVGSVATPFEHRSYGEELALCQRYYWKSDCANGNGNYVFIGSGGSGRATTDISAMVEHPVVMRTNPSISSDSITSTKILSGGTSISVTSINADQIHPKRSAIAVFTAGGVSVGTYYMWLAWGSTAPAVNFDAEL